MQRPGIVPGRDDQSPMTSSEMTSSSARRFCARPSAVSLLATGWLSPKPTVSSRLAAMPSATR